LRRQLLIYGLVSAALIGLAILVFELVIAPAPSAPPNSPGPVAAPAAEPRAAASPDGGPADGDQPAEAEPLPSKPDGVTVSALTGRVERRSPHEGWRPVAVGDRLGLNESLRTGGASSARLQVDERSRFELAEDGELSIRELTETVHQFQLRGGRIQVDYQPSGERVMRIESPDAKAVAEARAGKFGVLSAGKVVSVAAVEGTVRLTARDQSVEVGPGQISSASDTWGPLDAKPIPKAVLLKVVDPTRRIVSARHVTVQGRTDPGAQVRINDRLATVDQQGRFKTRVPLKEGSNRVVVVSLDAAGHRQVHDLGEVVMDPSSPVQQMQIQWGQDK